MVDEPKNINLEELPLINLKALVYDELLKVEQAQHNLNILRQEIAKRQENE